MKPKRHRTAAPEIATQQLHNSGTEQSTNEEFLHGKDEAAHETTKERVLNAALRLFAEQGFHGASIREICEQADANIATANYHFHGKDKLYAAVVERAAQQLRAKPADDVRFSVCRTPQQKLRAAIESLFECLTDAPDSARLLRLVARALAEQGLGFDCIAAALRTHAARLEEPLRQLLGPRTSRDRIHLWALSVTSQCVFFCATQQSLRRLCPQIGSQSADIEQLMAHVARFTAAAVNGMSRSSRKGGSFECRSKRNSALPIRSAR